MKRSCRQFTISTPVLINFLRRNVTSSFVPRHEPVKESQLKELQELVDSSSNILVLTGAGISTESGIPDYRSESVGLYARINHRPIQHQDFMKFRHIRQRYWARNFFGWPTFSSVLPNTTHLRLADWESQGKVSSVVTQNVDRLHHKGGSKSIVELHGCAYEVKCMNCNYTIPRHDFQDILSELNPSLCVESVSDIRPDADAGLSQEIVENFQVQDCQQCCDKLRGFFKPDIVFFGDNVPKPRVEYVFSRLQSSDCLVVLGSSLHVYSGYRFVLRAKELDIPIAIVNIGLTRGDKHANISMKAKCSEVLSKLII